jgi:hypothetical protein
LINTVIGLLQYAGRNPLGLFPAGYTYHDAFVLYANEFMGTLGNTDLLSSFLSVAVMLFYAGFVVRGKGALFLPPFAAGVFLLLLSGVSAGLVGLSAALLLTAPVLLDTKERFLRALLAGASALFSAGLYFCLKVTYENRVTDLRFVPGTYAVAAFLASAVLAGSAFLFHRKKSAVPWRRERARRVLIWAVAAVVLLGVALLLFVPVSGGTLYEARQLLKGNIDPSFGSGRIRIWKESLGLVPQHPWFGGGPDTLASRIGFSFTRYSDELKMTIESKIDNAHNDYLNILVNTGFLSLIFYLAALASALLRGVRRRDKNPMALIPVAAVLSYSVQVFFSFSICITAPFFWVALAWCSGESKDTAVERK